MLEIAGGIVLAVIALVIIGTFLGPIALGLAALVLYFINPYLPLAILCVVVAVEVRAARKELHLKLAAEDAARPFIRVPGRSS